MNLWYSIGFWRWLTVIQLVALLFLLGIAIYIFPTFAGARYWLLDQAAYYGDDISVGILLDAGASPDGLLDYPFFANRIAGIEFSSHLSQAAHSGNLSVVKRLLEAGADPQIIEGPGWTAIMSAAAEGHTDITLLLMEAGADPTANHGDGSALGIAEHRGHIQTVEAIKAKLQSK